MDITAFSYIGKTIDNFTSDFIVSGVSGLIDAISPLILIGVTIFLMVKGYLQIFGKSDDLARDTVILGIQVITITTLVLNIDNYTFYIIDGVNALSSGLSSAISKNESGNDIYQTLDGLLTQAVDHAVYCFKKVGLTEGWLWGFVGIIILASIGALTIISAIIIIGTKFLLTMLFVVGSLFIALAIFPITRKFFDSWVTKVVENVLVQIFGVVIISMAIEIISTFIGKNNPTVQDINPMGVMTQIVIVTGILTWVVKQIPNLSGSLAGGFASGSLTFKEAMAPAAAAAIAGAAFLNGAPKGEDTPQRDSWADQQANQVSKGNAQDSPQQTKGSQAINDKIDEHNRKS
jgi:type IV secretion system protein VirB6